MPSWVWIFILVFIPHVILAFVMSPPEAVARKIVDRFDLHVKLIHETADVSFEGEYLADDTKKQFIYNFNNALFIDRYYEILPKHTGNPVIIDTKRGKVDIRLFVYMYNDHVDVFKQIKKKVIAYRLLSESLQERSTMTQTSLVQV